MTLTPATLPRHELCGLHTRVAAARNRSLVGIEGRVVRETEQTVSVATNDRTKHVPKAGATFEFALGEATTSSARTNDPASAAHVTVDGDRLVAPPARRTETTGDSKWR
jgi:ribonuclease P protein subunit POP4